MRGDCGVSHAQSCGQYSAVVQYGRGQAPEIVVRPPPAKYGNEHGDLARISNSFPPLLQRIPPASVNGLDDKGDTSHEGA